MTIRRPILHVTHRPKPVDDRSPSQDAPVRQSRKLIAQDVSDVDRGNLDVDRGTQTQTSKSPND